MRAMVVISVMALMFGAAARVQGQSMTRSPGPPSVEARLDAMAKKLDEQNLKIDLLSQQILKLQQQLTGNGRPGVIIGEATPSPAPSPTTAAAAASSAAAAAPPAGAAGNSHVVARGETLTSIAKANSVSVSDLQKYNHIENPLKLQAGQTIMIPPSPSPAPSVSGSGE